MGAMLMSVAPPCSCAPCKDALCRKNDAREQLDACVKADQRNAHEYHVAKWLLAGPLKK